MKEVVKIFGLPRSGTNLLEYIIPINFNIEICHKWEFNIHRLGWKHSKPKSPEVYDYIASLTGEKFYFVFSIRNRDEWLNSMMANHWGSYELSHIYKSGSKIVFNTPMGPELYKSFEDYYDQQTTAYTEFCNKNFENSLVINYSNFKYDQFSALKAVEKKFELERTQAELIYINKKIDWAGNIVNEVI